MKLIEFINDQISLSVITGIFTYKMLSSFVDNILYSFINYKILPDDYFWKYNCIYDSNKKKINNDTLYNKKDIKHPILYGTFIKDFIIWLTITLIFYLIHNKNKK